MAERVKVKTIYRNLPKPLMPIGDVPILEILVKQLESAGYFNHYGSRIFESYD